MHYEIEPHITFHLAAKLEWLYRLYNHLANFSVFCRPPGFTTFVSPLSARYFRRARFYMNTLLQVSNKKFAHIFEGNNIPTQPKRSLSR